jgi:hypothetical protein
MRERRLLAFLGLALLSGCCGPAPRDAAEAMRRIEDNYAKIERPLYAKPALVSFRFRDMDGRDRRFIGQPAALIFQPPRSLYFDIQNSLAGSVARIGTNNERYWIWADVPDLRKLWWGTWRALAEGRARSMAVPPAQLLDALMLRPLPGRLASGQRPVLQVSGNNAKLLFFRPGEDGWPFPEREVRLDPCAPFLPLEIIDRRADGAVVMRATLGGYARIDGAGPDGPYTPRRYVVLWETHNAELRLDLLGVKFRMTDEPFDEFPEEWQGDADPLDAPPQSNTPAPEVS